ncbi:MAG: hypothetical protein U9R32_02840 [Bacteroidota bacterium]|nr:hypothetical protein [Bacteroidota bacterium]
MKQTITVKIGVGTYSSVMGGAELIELADHLPEEIKDFVKVEGAVCIKGCEDESGKTPPFASVNEKIIEQATIGNIIATIREELKSSE